MSDKSDDPAREAIARQWIAENPHTAFRLALSAHATKKWSDNHECLLTNALQILTEPESETKGEETT